MGGCTSENFRLESLLGFLYSPSQVFRYLAGRFANHGVTFNMQAAPRDGPPKTALNLHRHREQSAKKETFIN